MEKLKIGLFTDGPWGEQTLKKLVDDDIFIVDFVVLRWRNPDEQIRRQAEKIGIKVYVTENVNDDNFKNEIRTYKSDLFVSMSFDQIFRSELINMPKYKTINCHAGRLPFYRGSNVLNWVLINGESEFGITVHYMDNGIDTGDIILQKIYPITDEDDYSTLKARAAVGCSEILYDAIKRIQTNTVERIAQNDIDRIGTYFGKRQDGDELIDWSQTSREIFNFVRGICKPAPQAQSYVKGKRLYINKVQMVKGAHPYKATPGQLIGRGEHGFYVKTGDTMIELIEYTCDRKLRIGDRLCNQ